MPPKVAGQGKKKRTSRKKPRGRGLFGSIGGALGSAAGNLLGGYLGFGKKKRRGRGDMITSISPTTMGLKPGFIQA